VTNFLFFGNFGIDFLFHLFFLYRYARSLEEGSFRRRTSDFFFMLLFGALFLIGVTVVFAPPIHFLGSSLTFMLVYVWSKRNRDVQMRFMQMFNFTAPYLPWVLLAFSVLLHNNAVVDLMGIGAGHLYFFLEDVYPQLEGGRRVLITPTIIKAMFGESTGEALTI
jgi:Derlin-2/3